MPTGGTGRRRWRGGRRLSVNRDASLLVDDEPLARYFADIFDHDWRVLSKADVNGGFRAVEWAPAGAPTPEGMVRLTWKDYMETM